MGAKCDGKRNILWAFAKRTIFGPESGCEQRYADPHFLNMSTLDRMMLMKSCCQCCKWSKKTLNDAHMKTLEKNIPISCTNEKNIAMNHGDGSWRSTMKSMQNEHVSETIGESNNFEGHITRKKWIVKIRWKFIQFLTRQNRHVRATAGIVERAERCKI